MDHEALFNQLQAVKERLGKQADALMRTYTETLETLSHIEHWQRTISRELEMRDAVGSAK